MSKEFDLKFKLLGRLWFEAFGYHVVDDLFYLDMLDFVVGEGEFGEGACLRGEYISEKEERAKPASNIYYYYNKSNNLFK